MGAAQFRVPHFWIRGGCFDHCFNFHFRFHFDQISQSAPQATLGILIVFISVSLWLTSACLWTFKYGCYVVQENGTMFYCILVTVSFWCCCQPLHSSSTTMSLFILLNWDPLTHHLGIWHGKWQYYWYLTFMLNIMKEEPLKTSWDNIELIVSNNEHKHLVFGTYMRSKCLVVMIPNYHQNKLICCTIQVWDPAILTKHQNTIENVLKKECSWFKTVSIHFRKVWMTEMEGKTASKTPLKCPL